MRALLLGILVGFAAVTMVPAFAHPHGLMMMHSHTGLDTEITPLDAMTGIEKTVLPFSAPPNNTLPWGFVEGKIANHVEGHPVIIHMFSDGNLVHFAQTDVAEDGTYEYMFRVLNIENGQTITPFLGDYDVVIHKVVYLQQDKI